MNASRSRLLAALALGALAAGACTGREVPPPGAPGAEIFRLQNCANCHGPEGGGRSSLGPPLTGLSAHWSAEDLAAYLADPRSFVGKDARLQVLDRRYVAPMSAYANLTPEERRVLADWLLAR